MNYETKYQTCVKAIQSKDMIVLSEALLDEPSLIHATNNSGANLLHYAAATGNFEAFKLLRDNGTDPYQKDMYGDMPYDFLNTPSGDLKTDEEKGRIKSYLEQKNLQSPQVAGLEKFRMQLEKLSTIHDANEDAQNTQATHATSNLDKLGAQIASFRDKFFGKKENKNKPD